MYKALKKKLLSISISRRVLIFFISLIISSLVVTGFFFQKIYYQLMIQQVKESSMQTAISISSNIKTILGNVNSYSKVILSNDEVQLLLKSKDGYSAIGLTDSVNRTLRSMMGSINEISSIYLIDKNNHRYFVETEAFNYLYFNRTFYSKAWDKARNLRGAAYVVKNGGPLFRKLRIYGFVSSVRVINDLDTQKPIGGIMINISNDIIERSFKDISKKYGTMIYILDENNELITSSHGYNSEILSFINKDNPEKGAIYVDKDKDLIYTHYKLKEYDWNIITANPLEIEGKFSALLLTAFISLIILAALVLFGSMIITKMITKPINLLAGSMEELGRGNLKKVEFNTSIQEFNYLRDGYNKLTDEIETLINKVINQEKTKRKAELNTLQAQIKPHFLYNTFDSIASLALMGDTKQVYNMISSLGTFYRISLSKGREVITLGEEMEALKSYLNILHIRYDNFTVNFNLDEDLFKSQVLKLILQPFVENSIYHGIKPKGEPGEISISTVNNGKYISLIIEDDGIGMDENTLENYLKGDKSFGVKGTIERIRLFYNRDDLVEIKSQKGFGTKVEIKIPQEAVVLYE